VPTPVSVTVAVDNIQGPDVRLNETGSAEVAVAVKVTVPDP
jgi:hypothetical protein